ncbi:MAG: phosphotransferase [Candidatus Margulisbacteria bacterium]|nr:phosphotransferase [Candidatus Margulisiibacteriota bacterium]
MHVMFNIVAPAISRNLARNTGLPAGLKELCRLPERKMVLVDNSKRFPGTSMVLFPGFVVPFEAEIERIDINQINEVIVKLSPEAGEDQIFLSEKEILLSLPELEGIPRVIEAGKIQASYIVARKFEKVVDERPFIIMPKLAGEDVDALTLAPWQKGLPKRAGLAQLATTVFPGLAERLASLHAHDLVHRDVKPNNAMFDQESGLVSVVDFGRANWLKAEPRTDVGTFGFYPPELELEKSEKEDIRTDVYGLGTTCFTVLTGRPGILYDNMDNVWNYDWTAFMFVSREKVMRQYYEAIKGYGSLGHGELALRSNMPAELKETALGKYLARLFHPVKEKRPANMQRVVQQLRQLGGQLLEYEIWG